ncbi:MAG: hypothetical protein MJY62_02495 [Bacteroidales bacterium]|nr:hypothetical protein [Bacteroidales bacterium]
MNKFILKIAVLATALMPLAGMRAYAADWVAAPNAQLRSQLVDYLQRTAPTNLGAEPIYFMMQELMLQIEAAAETQGNDYVWMAQANDFCALAEDIYPPVITHPSSFKNGKMSRIRMEILRVKDYPIHETHLTSEPDPACRPSAEQVSAFTDYTHKFLDTKRQKVLQALDVPLQSGQCQVIKVYSSGYIMRTTEKTVALDICFSERLGTTAGMDKIVEATDILFNTHPHSDHYDEGMWRKMDLAGKPIVAPFNILKNGSKNVHFTMHTLGSDTKPEVHDTSTGQYADNLGEIVDIDVASSQGIGIKSQQDPVALYLYRIQTGDWSWICTGDCSNPEHQKGYEGKYEAPDFIFQPIFQGVTTLMGNVSRMKKTSHPTIYMNQHENEYFHEISGRMSFRYMFTDPGSLGGSGSLYPAAVVCFDNGESVIYQK